MGSARIGGTRVLRLRKAGMFSNVNEVVQQAFLAERDNYEFLIDWVRSCYRDEDRGGDPWMYYFEPCFPHASLTGEEIIVLEGGPAVACARDNIITPRMEDGKCDPLLLPRNRTVPARIIEKYVRLNARTRDVVTSAIRSWPDADVIGLHIRGPGRTDGGAPRLRAQVSTGEAVPLAWYFRFVDQALEARPGAYVFACSDSSTVIDGVKARYGERVVTYDAVRTAYGEVHAMNRHGDGVRFSGYRLGLDVVVEAHLLSQTVYFIHGSSNVANFVLCRNPHLPHRYVYEGLE
jgi:hypothetical protein